jgi:hypothetical protein
LAKILREQGQFGDETRGFYECCLAISIRNNGPDGSITASVNFNLGLSHHQLAGVQTTVDLEQKQLLLTKAYFGESHRINLKIYDPTHIDPAAGASQLATASSSLA